MHSDMAVIAARSRAEALDWSLVLVSQGIESTIHSSEAANRWELRVDANEHERAAAAIHLYQIENRGWPWQFVARKSGVRFDWGCIGWLFLIALFYWLDREAGLKSVGVAGTTAFGHGQWGGVFTAASLPAGLVQRASNATP